MRLSNQGYVLITTLIVLFVLTLLVTGSSESHIVNQKMQNNWEQYNAVFHRAEWGLQQLVAGFGGGSISLPDSPITLTTSYTLLETDACGNKMLDLQSTAKNAFSTVILNSRDIFARVPALKGCSSIPRHQIIWWREL
ncbi:MAG: hypothetical protein Q8L78_03285 [Coxiellaceae bacterium]|nr:hypothetical protein [Coxiellaceae bacterium]